MKNTKPLEGIVDELGPQFTKLSDEIWDEPQLRWTEHDAVEKQIAAAEQHGFTVTRNVADIPTAFMAERGSGGPVIGFLGEYDALAGLSQESGATERRPNPETENGNGQGCGHHLLGAGSLLAAVSAAKYLEDNNLPGTVRYYGCPAEEAAAGKSFMVAGGAFEGVDGAVTWHPGPAMSVWQVLTLAYTQVYFHFTGVASHAGASPHLGRSALDAVELLNVGVNFLREHMDDSSRIHYAITDAGGDSPNVVQANASVYYVVRATNVAQMRALYERVVKIAQGAALMTETELEIEFDGASAELLPNVTLEQALQANVEQIGPVPYDEADQAKAREYHKTFTPEDMDSWKHLTRGKDAKPLFDGIQPLQPEGLPRAQMTGSTDVGDVSWVTPTVQIMGGTHALGTPAHSWQWVSQGKLPYAHKGMIHAAKSMAATAIDMLTDGDVLARARAEFNGIIADTPYDMPIPEGVVAPPLRRR